MRLAVGGPFARADRVVGVDDHAAQAQDGEHDVLGDGDEVSVGNVENHDAVFAGGGNVDVVKTHAVLGDDLERRAAFDDLSRDLLGAGDERFDLMLVDLADEARLAPVLPQNNITVLFEHLNSDGLDGGLDHKYTMFQGKSLL